MSTELRHCHASKVLIDPEVQALVVDKDLPNVFTPTQRVRIITVKGQIFTRLFRAFGLTESGVVTDWDAHWHDWTQVNPNEEARI